MAELVPGDVPLPVDENGEPLAFVPAFPTEEEMLASGDAVAPENAELVTPPAPQVLPRERDRVQARRVVPSPVEGAPDDVEIREFTVSRINAAGELVSGLGRTSPADFAIEVVERAALELPRRRSTISAVLDDGSTHVLTGKGWTWVDEEFDPVDPATIRAFDVLEGPPEPAPEGGAA